MARDSDIKTYINYIDRKIIQDYEANERALKELEGLKPCYKAYNESLKKLKELEKKEKIKKISVIDKSLKEVIKIKREELREVIEKKCKNIAVRKQFIEIEELKSHYLSDQERYKLHFYGVSEELKGKYPELIEVLTEKKEEKHCFNCGSIELISEYQKNGKTPKGRQKYRQECRECRQERREKERENREEKAKKDQEAREEREREAERQRVRRREPKKICKVCGKKKPLSEYQKNGKTPKGRQKYRQECRECRQDQEKIRNDRQTRELNEGTERMREQLETMKGLYNTLKPGERKG